MRDILFISEDDWANVGTSFAMAGRKVGLDCLAVARRKHVFKYVETPMLVASWDNVQTLIDDFKAVVMMHSCWFRFMKRSGQRWAVFHGGSRYRTNPQKYSKLFNKMMDITLIQTGDLFGFGGVNERWMMPPIDTEYIQPVFSDLEKIRRNGLLFVHYPSSVELKGTTRIVGLIQLIRQHDKRCCFLWSSQIVSWAKNIERMGQCNVYLERLHPTQREWGVTVLEAAALGKIVVTQFQSRNQYEQEYQCACPLIIANTSEKLTEKVRWLLTFSAEKIIDLQVQMRWWAEKVHGYIPTGLRLKRLLLD